MTIDIGLQDPVFITINIHELSLAQYLELPFPEATTADGQTRWKSYNAGAVDLTFYCPGEPHADRAPALDEVRRTPETDAPGARAVDDV